MRLIYVAGPLSAPTDEGVLMNVECAMEVGATLMQRGWAVIVPHAMEFLERHHVARGEKKFDYEHWLKQDFVLIHRSDALFCVASSPGTDREVRLAESLGIPVFKSVEQASEWLSEHSDPEVTTTSLLN